MPKRRKKKQAKIKAQFDGATRGKRSGTFHQSVHNIRESISFDLRELQGRSTGAYINSPMIRSAVSQWVSDEIGSYVKVTPTSNDKAVNEALETLWKKHERFLDVSGDQNLHGILTTCSRERRINGEVFVRRIGRPVGRFPAPFQIQVISSKMVPLRSWTTEGGNEVRDGIEFKGLVKVAVWFKKSETKDYELVRVPIKNVIHSFVKEFVGQVRGYPSMSAAMLKEADYNSYEENELNRKASQSSVVGMITTEGGGEGLELTEAEDEEPNKSLSIGNNEILIGLEGENLVMNTSPDVGQNYKDFTSNNQRLVSLGTGVAYQLVTNNFDGVNDRTMRQINSNHRRKVKSERAQAVDFQIIGKLWRWFVDSDVLAGVSIPNYWEHRDDYRKCRFTAEAFAYDHVVQDLVSAEKAIELGVLSKQSFAEERGSDWEQNLKDKKEYERLQGE
jgi:lambda family phage portal protein